ncbi:MAG: 16S rRNA (guanine(527)-N(7))-methyltransferase RsmG [Candidatus Peregrinibacteria bacterium]
MIAEETHHRLEMLRDAFLEENLKLNLSAFRTPETCWTGNILDSVAALEVEPLKSLSRPLHILDLGTGGGFPLLPLAICLPQCTCTGMDSVQKKITAVQRIIDELKVPNVSLVCGRSEELARESIHREQYDVVLCRGFAALNVLLELAAPFVKVEGFILCWKSLTIGQELKDSLLARSELSCQMQEPYVYDLGGSFGRRQILVFRKRAKTNAKYPRSVGEPKKHPLL